MTNDDITASVNRVFELFLFVTIKCPDNVSVQVLSAHRSQIIVISLPKCLCTSSQRSLCTGQRPFIYLLLQYCALSQRAHRFNSNFGNIIKHPSQCTIISIDLAPSFFSFIQPQNDSVSLAKQLLVPRQVKISWVYFEYLVLQLTNSLSTEQQVANYITIIIYYYHPSFPSKQFDSKNILVATA